MYVCRSSGCSFKCAPLIMFIVKCPYSFTSCSLMTVFAPRYSPRPRVFCVENIIPFWLSNISFFCAQRSSIVVVTNWLQREMNVKPLWIELRLDMRRTKDSPFLWLSCIMHIQTIFPYLQAKPMLNECLFVWKLFCVLLCSCLLCIIDGLCVFRSQSANSNVYGMVMTI